MLRPYAGQARVARPLPQRVVGTQPAETVGVAADVDHPRARRREQQRQQPAGQREVPEVVRGHLQLEPVDRAARRRGHDARVVDQQVEPVHPAGQLLRGGPDGGLVGQVERQQLGRSLAADQLQGPRSPLGVAHGQDHASAAAGQHPGHLEPEAGAGTGDDRRTTALVRDVGRGPGGRLRHRVDGRSQLAGAPAGTAGRTGATGATRTYASALRRARVGLGSVGPQRHRPLGLRGDRERGVDAEVGRDGRPVHHVQPGIAVHPVVGVDDAACGPSRRSRSRRGSAPSSARRPRHRPCPPASAGTPVRAWSSGGHAGGSPDAPAGSTSGWARP